VRVKNILFSPNAKKREKTQCQFLGRKGGTLEKNSNSKETSLREKGRPRKNSPFHQETPPEREKSLGRKKVLFSLITIRRGDPLLLEGDSILFPEERGGPMNDSRGKGGISLVPRKEINRSM